MRRAAPLRRLHSDAQEGAAPVVPVTADSLTCAVLKQEGLAKPVASPSELFPSFIFCDLRLMASEEPLLLPTARHDLSVQALACDASLTLLAFLKKSFRPPLASAAHISRCLDRGLFEVNNSVQSSQVYRICQGDTVDLVATQFDIDATRFGLTPLNLLLYSAPMFAVFEKPPGMPTNGHQSDSLRQAIPPSLTVALPRSHLPPPTLEPIPGIGRSATGPVVVALEADAANFFQSNLSAARFRFTFRALVHGQPPLSFGCDSPGFLISFRILQTTPSTAGTLSYVEFVTTFGDEGVRRFFFDAHFPVIGRGALQRSTKVTSHGVFLSCTVLEFPNPTPAAEPAVVRVVCPLAPKFEQHLRLERRFFEERAERQRLQTLRSAVLRSAFLDRLAAASEKLGAAKPFVDLLASPDADFVDFCGLPLLFNGAVMAPRMSSEVLVRSACELALASRSVGGQTGEVCVARAEEEGTAAPAACCVCDCACHPENPEQGSSIAPLRLLDIGVGSGALLVGLLKGLEEHFPDSVGVGVDISQQALEVANVNCLAHELSSRVYLFEDDFFKPGFLSSAQGCSIGGRGFNVIVCNPPYLTDSEIKREVNDLRGPDVALVAKDCQDPRPDQRMRKGLGCYDAIAKALAVSGSESLLREGGRVVVELGGKRSKAGVQKLFELNGLVLDTSAQDSNNHTRCLVFGRPECCTCKGV